MAASVIAHAPAHAPAGVSGRSSMDAGVGAGTAARSPLTSGPPVAWRQAGWWALALLFAAAPAWADRDGRREGERDASDQARARAAVQAGEVMALPELLARLQRSHPGQVLGLELEREDGRWIYEVKLLQADGQLLKLELDARSAEVLKQRRRAR